MVKDSRLCAAPRTTTVRTSHVISDNMQLSAGMAADLFAELGGRVPNELVAEIVRTVLDDNRRAAQEREVEVTMSEARQRLERFIRARSAS